MRKVLICIEQASILVDLVDERDVNPGYGGTSFTALRLALELKALDEFSSKNFELFIGVRGGATIDRFFDIPVVDLENCNIQWDIAIITGGILNYISDGTMRLNAARLISWIRHPYDFDKIRKARKINSEIVSVGQAAYASNFLINGRHHFIENLFCGERVRAASDNRTLEVQDLLAEYHNRVKNSHSAGRIPLTIGFMGALVESKGFHVLAQQWERLSRELSERGYDVYLLVIGGADLYGMDASHSVIPTSAEYGNRLFQDIAGDIGVSIFFLGTLGRERYQIMSLCNLGIVNPLGEGEAFPATVLEWFALGVPSFGPLAFGCIDVFSKIPELVVPAPSYLADRVIHYVSLETKEKQEIKMKCQAISSLYSSKQGLIIQQWRTLLFYSNGHLDGFFGSRELKSIINSFIKMAWRELRMKVIFRIKIILGMD